MSPHAICAPTRVVAVGTGEPASCAAGGAPTARESGTTAQVSCCTPVPHHMPRPPPPQDEYYTRRSVPARTVHGEGTPQVASRQRLGTPPRQLRRRHRMQGKGIDRMAASASAGECRLPL